MYTLNMSKKFKVTPIHLVLSGVTVIILGILIPSFFISAFSTIGFAIVIGVLLLAAAYIFFSVNTVKSKGKRAVKWIMIPVVLLLLIIAGYYGYNLYIQYLNEKVYTYSDTLDFGDFSLEVKKPEFSKITFTVPKEKQSRYGGINTNENCSKYPWDNGYYDLDWNDEEYWDEDGYEKDHPTRDYCNWRNNSRKEIKNYIASNEKLNLSLTYTAKNKVNPLNIKVTLLPDSGRSIYAKKTIFDHDPLLSKNFVPAFNFRYHPYTKSDLGGDINKGIKRTMKISADIRNSEEIVDLKVVYEKDGNKTIRLIRITR